MKSEKVKEIKKAWGCCGSGMLLECPKCPYVEKGCEISLIKDTLTLINELERENKELKKYKVDWLNGEKMHLQADLEDTEFELGFSNRCLKKVGEENQQIKDRIAELEKEKKDYYDRLNNLQTYIDNHEEIWKINANNALKQFAEILKEEIDDMKQFYSSCLDREYSGLTKEQIDETLKEFVEVEE